MIPAGSVVALALVAGTTALPVWVPGEHAEPTIRISVENWGADVVLDELGAVAYAHLGTDGTLTHVTVTIDPGRDALHGFYGRLTAPDAVGGEQVLYCGEEYRRVESSTVCGFDLPMSSGENRLTFDLQSASFDGIRTSTGVVHGAALAMVPVLEARLPDGSWRAMTAAGVELAGERVSAVRYRLLNTGTLPFRVPHSCQPDGTVWPDQQLLCTVRGERPGYALAGEWWVPVELHDPVGGVLGVRVHGRIEATGLTGGPIGEGS